MNGVTLPLALLAGVVSFASPCFLPVVPVFIGYLVGSAPDRPNARRAAVVQSLFFVLGFAVVFVAMWVGLGVIGYVLGDYRAVLRVVGGIVLVVLGLHVAGLVEISVLYRTTRGPLGQRAAAPTARRSVVLGIAFGAGWTPCIGPILGGIIGLASVQGSAGEGFLLLVAYVVGLGIPFVLVAVGANEVSRRMGWFRRHETAVSLVTGGLLVVTGFLMITNLFARLSGIAPGFGL